MYFIENILHSATVSFLSSYVWIGS